MPILVVAAVVAAGAAVASTAVKQNAQRKALNAQMDALKDMREIDPEAYAKLAKEGDITAWRNRLDAMRSVDPQLASLRDNALKVYTNQLASTASESNRSDGIAKMVYGLAQQFAAGAPADMALGDALIAKAQEKLGRGGQLPPTYQAELVRSGLETTGAAGLSANRKGAVTGVIGRLLGSEMMNVERQNEQDAMILAQAGQQLSGNRMSILQGLIPQFQNYEQAKLNMAGQALNAVNAETPSKIGLSGADLVNMYEKRRLEKNTQAQEVAKLQAAKVMNQAEATSGYIQAGSSLVQGVAGAGGGGGPVSNMGIFQNTGNQAAYTQAMAPVGTSYNPITQTAYRPGTTGPIAGLAWQ